MNEPTSCGECGAELLHGGNFCPSCGAPVTREGEPDRTTAAIEIGQFDATASLEGSPKLVPGTAMLVVVRGPNAGARFLLDRDVTTIGRHPDCDIFLHDVTVSRRHSEVRRAGEVFTVIDLGSLNGSYVNGERLEQHSLDSGDELQVGRFKLLFLGALGKEEG